MEVKPIVYTFLANTMAPMHKTRLHALAACVESTINGSALTVTGLGRGIQGGISERYNMKRSDRLCSNPHLFREQNSIYGAICKQWVPKMSRPVILVDWSDLDDCKNAFLVSAVLVVDGRPITLYLEVHPLARKEKPKTHKLFLKTLKDLLPENCKPIIAADAGFKVPWHELVLSLGWDYVGRVRKPNSVCIDGVTWHPVDEIFKAATSTAKYFEGGLTISKDFATRFVLYKGPNKGRHKKTAEGKRCASKHSEQHAASGREPWLLATSLPVTSGLAKKVINIYSTRMQIELGYRDMKSRLYGLGFNQSESCKIKRIAILMLIAVLAAIVLILIGAAAEQAGYAQHFQANTTKDRRVLSLHFLGLRMVASQHLTLAYEHFEAGVRYLKQRIAEANNGFNKFA
jgi:hypothetical protein